jgi:hypothetical protein
MGGRREVSMVTLAELASWLEGTAGRGASLIHYPSQEVLSPGQRGLLLARTARSAATRFPATSSGAHSLRASTTRTGSALEAQSERTSADLRFDHGRTAAYHPGSSSATAPDTPDSGHPLGWGLAVRRSVAHAGRCTPRERAISVDVVE